ncbi:hypothetical protein AB0J63_17575 [Streptosporangium canum]|uniref:hypothetical protein n=1 Tax=Streptosporangium canum TaxID=324952 RepID=UPI0034182B6E
MAPDANIPEVRQLPEEFQEAAEQSPAVRHAEDLAAVLDDVYGIPADVHELRSGNALVSVFPGLLAYTDGESFWWTSPELSGSGAPVLSSALALLVAAEQLAAHYAILRVRPATSLLDSELPLPADVILADHVAPS